MKEFVLVLLVLFSAELYMRNNNYIINSLLRGEFEILIYRWPVVLATVKTDIAFICCVLHKFKTTVVPSLRLARNELKNRSAAKKKAAMLEEASENEALFVTRLQEQRKEISISAIRRTLRFCQLMEAVAGKEQMQGCMSMVKEKQGVLDEIAAAEKKLLEIAEGYKNAGDTEKCRYYLSLIQSDKLMPEVAAVEKECQEQALLRAAQKDALQLWKTLFVVILAGLAVIGLSSLIDRFF